MFQAYNSTFGQAILMLKYIIREKSALNLGKTFLVSHQISVLYVWVENFSKLRRIHWGILLKIEDDITFPGSFSRATWGDHVAHFTPEHVNDLLCTVLENKL